MYELLERGNQYGIRIGATQVLDISTDREAVLALLHRMEQGGLNEVHVFEVIENWFGEEWLF